VVRALWTACVLLAALCVLQWGTLSRLQADLAAADAHAIRVAHEANHEDLARTIGWLDAYMRSPEGLGQPAGLCPGGVPDTESVGQWVFGVYAAERARGASEAKARRRVIDAIRLAREPSH